jgi:excisionase family DNA binding protein
MTMAQNDPITEQLLTVAEIAARMRVSKMTVYRLVHSGALLPGARNRRGAIPRLHHLRALNHRPSPNQSTT